MRDEIAEVRREVRNDLQKLSNRFETDIRMEGRKEIKILRAEVEKLSYHQRKYNLIFKGIKAEVKPSCEEAILELCKAKLEIHKPITIVNAHRMGKNNELIIAQFLKWEDRCSVLFTAKKLKGTDILIQSDLPDSLRGKRAELVQKVKV